MHIGVLLVAGFLVSGCTGAGDEDLLQWMAEQKAQTKPKVVPISEPKQFKPESYTQVSAVEPFSREKLTQALRRDSSQVASNGALVAPELARRKEPLEAFPLDSMALVGSLVQAGKPVALVKVDSLLYQVRPGNYLGQNYGRVTKINETEVTLREIVQDAVGEWIERTATLQLQEKSK
ncbi:MAG TPA: pilus assembly protein PilP [Burkholderiaceae bacterium]|nr:pilus assembly protein PilP [Rhodoferax sp.]HNW01437.1 pilus assembly protein PilP [Burkholderiaceae bacterium]HPW07463.1 pilus assembly protein PilP [Burkholderiaceae bacterium]